MKIISIGLYNPLPIKSGADSYISYLLNPLGKNHDVLHYYFFQSDSEKGHYPNEINFRTKYLKTESLQKFQGIPKLLQLLRPELIINKRPLKKISADIVICDTFTFHAGRYISKINKCPLVLIKHNIEWQYLQANGSHAYLFLKAYENHILRKADAIVTISMNDYRYISEYMDEDVIYYLPPNVNTLVFNPDGPSYDFGDDKFNLLFYGSLDRPMNIEALKFIKHSLVSLLKKVHLLKRIRINVFGSGIPPKSLQIERDKDINYLGAVEDPGKYIRGVDLVIVPVRNSGGIKIRLLETLFCGKPVIVTPESAEGLPNKLKKLVYVEKDANGFLRVIKQFLEKQCIVDKIDTDIIKDYVNVSNSNTLCDTIDNLLGIEKPLKTKKEGQK